MNEKRVTLKPIVHDRATTLWCGPGALAILSGRPTSEIHRVLQEVTGRQTIKGVWVSELRKAADKLGIVLTPGHGTGTGFTLAQWTRQNKALLASHTILLQVSNHFVVVSGRQFVDNQNQTPIPLSKAPGRRRRVKQVLLVSEHSLPVEIPAPAPRRVDDSRKERTEAKALAALHGISIEPYEHGSKGEFWVFPPPALTASELDRYDDFHLAFDWSDVLERVKGYVADLTARVA